MSRSAWKLSGVVGRRHLYYGKGKNMVWSALILVLIGLAIITAAVIGVVIVVLVMLARKKRAGKSTMNDRDQPPGY